MVGCYERMIDMIICKIYIKDIDYKSVVERIMPMITKELSEKDNFFFSLLKKIISKNNKPSITTRFLLSIVPNKDEIAVSLVQQYSEEILSYANELLDNIKISAKIKTLRARTLKSSCSKYIKFEITIDNIDYEKTCVNVMPYILSFLDRKLKMSDKMAGKAVSIFTRNYDLIEKMLLGAIKAVPEIRKDELLVNILKEFKKEIIRSANRAIEENKIKAEIKNIALQFK